MIKKVAHISKRLPRIQERLRGMADGMDPASSSASMLAAAYEWFYKSGKHTYGGDNHLSLENELESATVFNELLAEDPRSIYKANAILLARNAPPKHGPSGFRLRESNVCIAPSFASSFKLIPASLQGLVVEKLKELAALTGDEQADRQKRIMSKAKVNDDLITVDVGPGIRLCIEPEAVRGVAFLGFLVAGTYRQPISGALPSGGRGPWLTRLAKASFAMSVLALVIALVYVPHDVILTGNGPTLRVFSGYDFVWAPHVLNEACQWYTNETFEGRVVATKNCYSVLAMPRIAMTLGAALVMAVLTFLWMRSRSRAAV